ncbi:MAG: M48 family metallopeptidase [Dysgonamonadaceae bacterium]|nr:M48 family metallopeptidase [Dysgonamonadaceae bacterium]
MKKLLLLSVILSGLLVACSTVPITGRQQLNLVSDQEVLTLSLQEYTDFMKTAKKSTDKTNTALVTKVGTNIANAVSLYFKSIGQESLLSEYSWEFNLVEDAQVNAFCMPGGKIVVYTGILPVTQDETGLAVVLGHEVGHAIAKHANERLSQQIITQYGTEALTSLLGGKSEATKTLAQQTLGLGAQYGVMLPFGRKQELEADHLGLDLMAIAGYDPQKAVSFWQRMSASGTAAVPEFLSTHPSDASRIAEIQKYLPEAMEVYNSIHGTK